MDHRIADTNVLTFADPDKEPDSIGMCFDLADLPAEWGQITPTAVRMDGLDIRVTVQTDQGVHDLLLANDAELVAEGFKNFDTVVLLGLDDDGQFALDCELPWSDR